MTNSLQLPDLSPGLASTPKPNLALGLRSTLSPTSPSTTPNHPRLSYLQGVVDAPVLSSDEGDHVLGALGQVEVLDQAQRLQGRKLDLLELGLRLGLGLCMKARVG